MSIDDLKQDAIKVHWHLDCSDRVGIVTGYRIHYCAIESMMDTADCVGRDVMWVDADPTEDRKWLTSLKPWTIYKVRLPL